MQSAIRKVVAAFAVVAALVYFFSSSEEEGGVPILDWLRDPAGSRDRHAAHLAGEDDPALGGPLGAGAALPPGPSPRWSGRALRLDGSPVAGLALRAGQADPGRTTTDAQGRFTLPPGAQSERVQLEGEHWVLLGSGSVATGTAQDEMQLVVAPRTALAGRVTDATGAPIEGAMVAASMPLALAAGDAVTIQLAANYERRALTDAEGRFRLTELPLLPVVRIEATKPGYQRLRRPLPEDPSLEVEIVLEPAASAQPR